MTSVSTARFPIQIPIVIVPSSSCYHVCSIPLAAHNTTPQNDVGSRFQIATRTTPQRTLGTNLPLYFRSGHPPVFVGKKDRESYSDLWMVAEFRNCSERSIALSTVSYGPLPQSNTRSISLVPGCNVTHGRKHL